MMEHSPSYFAIIPAEVRYDKDLKPNAKLLYGEITALANQKGYCYATNKYFADLYGVANETVSRWISQLSKKGYISIDIVYKEDSKEIHERRIYIGIDKKINRGIDKIVNTDKNVNRGNDKKVKDNNTIINNINNNKEKASKDDIPYEEIINYLNEKTGKKFRVVDSNKKLIRARWREKYTLEDFKKVIDIKVEKWLGNDMEEYLRPKTLFASSHFDDYLNEAEKKFKKQEGTSNPSGEYIDKGTGDFGDFAEEWARQMNPDNMFGR